MDTICYGKDERCKEKRQCYKWNKHNSVVKNMSRKRKLKTTYIMRDNNEMIELKNDKVLSNVVSYTCSKARISIVV